MQFNSAVSHHKPVMLGSSPAGASICYHRLAARIYASQAYDTSSNLVGSTNLYSFLSLNVISNNFILCKGGNMKKSFFLCPKCGHHFITKQYRLYPDFKVVTCSMCMNKIFKI